MAVCASVTVSIGEETNGVFSVILRVRRVRKLTASAEKSMNPGSTM